MNAIAPEPAASPSPVRTRRVSDPWRVAVVAVLAGALLAAAFVAGRFFQAPDTDAAEQASAPIIVWASVEERAVNASATFTGTVSEGERQDVGITADGPAVVLRQHVKPGRTVHPGDAAGEVSGVTYVFLGSPLALYRDLTEGDRGEDVVSLQRGLKAAGRWTPTDGVLGPATARALRGLFADAGAPLPADVPVSVGWRQFVPIPAAGAIVTEAAEYGATLDEEHPLLRLQTTPPAVTFVADVTQAETLAAGDEVRLTSSAGETTGLIEQVGEFEVGQEGTRAGHPVTVTFDAADPAAPPVGQSVSVTPATTSAPGLAVPQTAVRSDAQGSYVLVQDTGSSASATPSASPAAGGHEGRRVPVTVQRTGGGWASVAGGLTAGDRVKVS